jgi:hypothetical protein
MNTQTMLRRLPLRLTAGAYILNSGLSKRRPDDSTAAALHGMAAGTYPFLREMKAGQFVRILSTAEIGLGAALLVPVVPAALAGAGLLAFSAGLVGLYLRTPGMREPGSLRPTQQGIALAKDVWLTGIGASLLADGLDERSRPART